MAYVRVFEAAGPGIADRLHTGVDAAHEGPAGVDFAAFVSPSFDNPKLSPDGKQVAVRRVAEDRPYVEVYALSSSESVAAFIPEEGLGIADHHWGTTARCSFRFATATSSGPTGYPAATGCASTSAREKNEKLFENTPRRPLSSRGLLGKLRVTAFSDHFIANAFDDDANGVLVLFPDGRTSWASRYDTRRDRYRRLADVPGDIFDIYADRAGRVLAT